MIQALLSMTGTYRGPSHHSGARSRGCNRNGPNSLFGPPADTTNHFDEGIDLCAEVIQDNRDSPRYGAGVQIRPLGSSGPISPGGADHPCPCSLLKTFPRFAPANGLDTVFYPGYLRLAHVHRSRMHLVRVVSDHCLLSASLISTRRSSNDLGCTHV